MQNICYFYVYCYYYSYCVNAFSWIILSPISDFTSYQYGGGASLSPSMASDLRSTSGEFVVNNAGWINTVPLSSNTSTLSKRSNRSKRMVNPDVYVKDYLKKRALILSLLVSWRVVPNRSGIIRVDFFHLTFKQKFTEVYTVFIIYCVKYYIIRRIV